VITDRVALRERVGDAFLVTVIAYGILTATILIGADWLTRAMAQQPELQVTFPPETGPLRTGIFRF
jgi:hypothetical protein